MFVYILIASNTLQKKNKQKIQNCIAYPDSITIESVDPIKIQLTSYKNFCEICRLEEK